MQLLPFLTSDIARIQHLQPDGWPPVQPYFEFYTSSEFCHPFKLISGTEIVAVGCCILHADSAWVAHIIVDKARRGQGIGAQMTQALVDCAHRMERRIVQLVATEMGAPLYRKLGFENDGVYLFMKGGKCIESQAQPLIPYEPAFRDEVLVLDREASGEDRFRLIEPHLVQGLLSVEDQQVAGYYLPTLGEGLIVARDETTGLMLLRERLKKEWLYQAIPEGNTSALNLLQELGYQHYRTGWRMFLGPRKPWNPKMIFGRIGGNSG